MDATRDINHIQVDSEEHPESVPEQDTAAHESDTLVQYALAPRQCLPDFREALLDRTSALKDGPHATFYLRLLQYVLYSRFLDEETGLQVLPREVVAACLGVSPNAWGFRARDWLDRFGSAVCDLRYSAWTLGRARTINPDLPPDLLNLWMDQCARLRRAPDSLDTVDFVTGTPNSRRKRDQRRKVYAAYLDTLCAEPPSDHPASRLVAHLHGSGQRVLRKIVRSNWDAMNDWVDAMPAATELDLRRRKYVERLMQDIADFGIALRYDTSEATTRVYAVGANINCLPRDLRKIALRGTVALDLRAAQLAIVSKVYDCPALYRFLADGGDFWEEMLQHLGIDRTRKQLLKNAIYGICFGMGRARYRELLCTGRISERDRIIHLMDDPGLGGEITSKFLRHPLISELLRQRQKAMRAACVNGGAYDAFGRWQVLKNNYPPSLLANIAQSYEVRIMLAILPIVESERGIEIASFLHDGVYLHFTDKREQNRQLFRLREAVSAEAVALGVPTSFE